jgi:hypothetical protein
MDICEARVFSSFHGLIQFLLFFIKPENLTQTAGVKMQTTSSF